MDTEALRNKEEKKAEKASFTLLNSIYTKIYKVAISSPSTALVEAENISVTDFRALYEAIYINSGLVIYEKASSELKRHGGTKRSVVSFFSELWRTYILNELLNTEITKRITKVYQTTKDDVRRVLIESANNRLAPREIGRELKKRVGFNKSRALMIARTEMTNVAAMAVERAGKDSELELYKVWNHYPHGKFRESHLALNKTYVAFNEKFKLEDGIEMKRPGDPSGGASEVINCRCNMSLATADVLIELGLWRG